MGGGRALAAEGGAHRARIQGTHSGGGSAHRARIQGTHIRITGIWSIVISAKKPFLEKCQKVRRARARVT